MPDPVTQTTTAQPGAPAAAPSAPAGAAPPAARPPAAAKPAPAAPGTRPAQTTRPAGAPTASQADDLANDRTLSPAARAKWAKYRDDMTGKLTAAEQRAKQMEEQYTSTKADYDRAVVEQDLKVELARAGIRDMDYAWFQLKKHMDSMARDTTPEGVERFRQFAEGGVSSVRAWAEEQRAATPYIFGEMPVPATTGAVRGTAPPPTVPGAPGVSAATARAGSFDGMNASKEDFEARMRELGINHRDARAPLRR
jgi:hypothetical protein